MKEIEFLIAELAESGTGASKIEALTNLLRKCETPKQFAEQASSCVPPGTVLKIKNWFERHANTPKPIQQEPESPTEPEKPEPPVKQPPTKAETRGKR